MQECKEEERGLAVAEGRRESRARSGGPGAQVSDGVTSYLVASSPEVLSHLLRENEARGDQFNPALYTNPANALNITKIDFAPVDAGPGRPPPPSPLARRPRQASQSSCPSLERRESGAGRSLPGSAQSTLSRPQSPAPLRRRPSAARSQHSSSQVPGTLAASLRL